MGLQPLCSVALAGGWATGYQTCAPNLHFGLSTWALYEGKGSKGNMPHPEAPPEHNVSCFKRLTKVFEAFWQQVPQEDPTAHNMVVLYCKVGRHRSYAHPNRIIDAELSNPRASVLGGEHKPHPQ